MIEWEKIGDDLWIILILQNKKKFTKRNIASAKSQEIKSITLLLLKALGSLWKNKLSLEYN